MRLHLSNLTDADIQLSNIFNRFTCRCGFAFTALRLLLLWLLLLLLLWFLGLFWFLGLLGLTWLLFLFSDGFVCKSFASF